MVNKVGRKRLFLVWSCLVSILPGMAQTEKLTDYVNPFVGTDGYGNVYPGAQIPFGGIQISPDTDRYSGLGRLSVYPRNGRNETGTRYS